MLTPVPPPRVPEPTRDYEFGNTLSILNTLRLYFNRLSAAVNAVIGRNGGAYIEVPNGMFFDTGDQALGAVNVAQPVRFNHTYIDNGVSINGATTSEITVAQSGVYNIQATALLRSNSGSSKIAYFWINRNGTDIGYSAKEYSLSGAGKLIEMVWSFNIDVQAGQYIQLRWSGDDINMSLDTVAATSPHPGIPSAVVAIMLVSTLPDPLPTPP